MKTRHTTIPRGVRVARQRLGLRLSFCRFGSWCQGRPEPQTRTPRWDFGKKSARRTVGVENLADVRTVYGKRRRFFNAQWDLDLAVARQRLGLRLSFCRFGSWCQEP